MAAVPQFDLRDARWLGHRYVEDRDAYRFIHVPRGDHAGIPFLTDDYLGDRPIAPDLPAATVLAQCEDGPLHFLFHSAFCGSTLLTRAFDVPGTAMGLSEPMVLNDVAGFRKRGAPGEAVLVKPSNIVNGLIELFMALQPQARAVFLYAPLETFLISVARKGLPCRLWVRELAENYLREGLFEPLGLGAEELFRQTDLQVAASGWLAQHRLIAALIDKLGSERLKTLDADGMATDPRAALEAVAGHYGFALDSATLDAIAAGPAFTRHSKSGAAFTPEDRAREYAAARSAYGEEIDMVLVWSDRLADAAGIALKAPASLI
jgi:hypothetical protein